MAMQESGQMYLETILVLSKERERVRSIDIAEQMGFSKPSVSRAMGLLKNNGYITVDGLGSVELTEEGRRIAEVIYERHTILTKVLIMLGVDEKTAAEDACKMEHYISDTSFEAIKQHMREQGVNWGADE
ncbi:MAG: metal-dependent transcriptional regulator [Clostridia bacterium]|nr:metal-dependent transcriptional regulator [Clostridia bacterium]